MRSHLFNSPAALLAIITTALVSLGIIFVYSSSGARAGVEMRRAAAAEVQQPVEDFAFHHHHKYVQKQVVWTILGLIGMMVMMKIPIDKLEKYSPHFLGFCTVLLILVVASPLGVSAKGANRWLSLGVVTIQPAEFSKIALIMFMAWFLSKKRDDIREFKRGFVPTVGIWVLFAFLIALERDFGTIILMGSVMLGMWCLARMKMSHIASLALASLPVMIFLLFQYSYRIRRILAFFNPDAFMNKEGYQLHQSLIAVGSGGIFGKGLGLGFQKYHFLPEAHTDFIFATVCEELGFIGGVCVLMLFLGFALTGFRISYRAPDYFGGLVAAGITMTIVFAAFINFAVVLGLVPTKGLALPFFSYGGSAMVSSLLAVGLLINIANYTAVSHGGE